MDEACHGNGAASVPRASMARDGDVGDIRGCPWRALVARSWRWVARAYFDRTRRSLHEQVQRRLGIARGTSESWGKPSKARDMPAWVLIRAMSDEGAASILGAPERRALMDEIGEELGVIMVPLPETGPTDEVMARQLGEVAEGLGAAFAAVREAVDAGGAGGETITQREWDAIQAAVRKMLLHTLEAERYIRERREAKD